jgi:PAS domain S-box-containing protein
MNGTLDSTLTATAPTAALDIDEIPLPYAEVDARGIIIRANRAALALHHPEQGDLIGKSGWDLMALGEKNFSSAAFLSQIACGEDPPIITRGIFDRSGTFRTYEMHRSLIRNAHGRPAGMRMIFVDVTDARKQLNDARLALKWFENAIASLADAVVLTDPLGFVRTVNRAAEKLFRCTAQELVGKIIEEAIPIAAYEPLDGAPLDRRTAIEKQCKGIATLLIRERQEIKVEIRTSPILDKDSGSIAGVAAILRRTGSEART